MTNSLQELIPQANLPAYTGMGRTKIAELVAAGEFPKPIKLSSTGRAKAWLKSEVQQWQTTRIAASQAD